MQAKDRDRISRTLARGDFVPRGGASQSNDGPGFYPTRIDDNNYIGADHVIAGLERQLTATSHLKNVILSEAKNLGYRTVRDSSVAANASSE